MTLRQVLAQSALTLAIAASASAAEGDGKWLSLFNGKDLDGWTPKITGYELGDNFGDTFRVQDGVIRVSYDKYDNQFNGRFGHLFYKVPYSNYIFRAEYRFTGEQCPGGPGWALRNSGVMIHGQLPQTMTKGQNFPVSIEVQLLGGNGKNDRTTGNLCTPGTHVVVDGKLYTPHGLTSKSKTFHGEQWVTIEIEAHGGKTIKHKINGETVLEYEQSQYDPGDGDAKKLITGEDRIIRGGSISLQSESHPVEFRKIEIMTLAE